MKIDISKLVISQPLAEKLVKAGLHSSCAFCWVSVNGKVQAIEQVYAPQGGWPAWTYEEIRIMIGNEHVAPDLREPRPNALKGEDLLFCCYYLDRTTNNKSGAEAAGEFLLELIEKKMVKADDANRRYLKKFRPE